MDETNEELQILREFFTHWNRLHHCDNRDTKLQSAQKMIECKERLIELLKPVGIVLSDMETT